jgi:hypothetical protein
MRDVRTAEVMWKLLAHQVAAMHSGKGNKDGLSTLAPGTTGFVAFSVWSISFSRSSVGGLLDVSIKVSIGVRLRAGRAYPLPASFWRFAR